jgi:xyloglucan-specific endo-beta-1,4-glucanase
VQPIGSNQGNVNVGGRNWELWYGLNGNMKVFSFVASSPVTSYNGNLKDFFNYMANNRGFPASSQYLISKFLLSVSPFQNGSGADITNACDSLPVWYGSVHRQRNHLHR